MTVKAAFVLLALAGWATYAIGAGAVELAQAEAPRPADPGAAEFKQSLEQARAAEKAGDHRRAIALYEQALAAAEKLHGADHPDAAGVLNILANLHVRTGEHGKALPLYQRSLAIYEKVLGPEHAAVAVSLTNIGNLYRRGGEHAKAAPFYERSLAIHEKSLGPAHATTAAALLNLATAYREMG